VALLVGSLGAQPRIFQDTVQPHWFGNGSQFWYRRDLPQGAREFVRVDALSGRRQPAFDHQRVARSLGLLTAAAVDGKRLPFWGLRFEPGHVLLCGPTSWRLNLSSYQLVQAFGEWEPLPVLREVGPYATRRVPTRIQFVNQTGGEVKLFWLDAESQPQPHAQLAAGARLDQATFDGQDWVVEDVTTGGRLAVFRAIDGPAQAVIDCPPPRDPRLSPDGNWVLEVRDHNLWLRGRGEERALSRDGQAGDEYSEADLCWSPDSRKVLALRTRRAPREKYPRPGQEHDRASPRLFHVDSGQQFTPTEEWLPQPLALHSLRWSADSSRVTFVYQQRGHQVLRLLALDGNSGQVKCLIEERSPTFVCDSQKYFCHWLSDSEVLWMSERSGWNHLWLFDVTAGTPGRAMTAGPWVVQKVAEVDNARRQCWFWAGGIEAGRDPYYARYCRLDVDSGAVQVLTHEDGHHRVQVSPSGAYLVDTWSRVDRPPVTDLLRAGKGEKVCRLEEAPVSGRLPRSFVAKGRDGETDIYGVIYFPKKFQAGRKYPVVEHIYAGPHQFSTPKDFEGGQGLDQELADRGVIVVQCDGMGTPGRSKAFHDVCYKNLRDAGFPDRMAWIRAAAQRYPQMDLNRVGLYGSSAGGANAVAALLWHSDLYKVAVADCGNHDGRLDNLYWQEQWMGWPVGPEYAQNSNLTWANQLQGKLLLMVGDQDDKVDPDSTLLLAEALGKAAKPYELWVKKGGKHCLSGTKEGWLRLSDFLVKHL
jgi:dipeptidyl aminopeptidase/acylaminoacyl peptidase